MAKNSVSVGGNVKARELSYGTPMLSRPPMVGQQGTTLSLGLLSSFNGFRANPNWVMLPEYERAFLTDECIGTGIEFVVLTMLASLDEYEHPNAEIQAYVRDNLVHMAGTPQAMIGDMLTSALWSGHAVSEPILETDGKHYYLKSVENYHPASIHYVVDRNGKLSFGKEPALHTGMLTGIYQRHPFEGRFVPLPRNRVCHIAHNARHGNYYGEPIIQRIFKHWLFKDAVMGMWAVAMDRYGSPIPVIIVPRVTTGNMVDDPWLGAQRPETYAESALRMAQQITNGGSLVFEELSKDHPVKVSALTPPNNFGSVFLDAVRNANAAMWRGMLIPKLLLDDGKSGSSKGLATIHFNVFRMLVESWYTTMVQPIVQQIIGPLVYWNFGERNPGCFPMRPFDAIMAEIILPNLEKLMDAGAIDPNYLPDVNTLRRMVRYSPISQQVLDKREFVYGKKEEAKENAKAQGQIQVNTAKAQDQIKINAAQAKLQARAKDATPVAQDKGQKESLSMSYKDVPEDVKRQMEKMAGFVPSKLPPPKLDPATNKPLLPGQKPTPIDPATGKPKTTDKPVPGGKPATRDKPAAGGKAVVEVRVTGGDKPKATPAKSKTTPAKPKTAKQRPTQLSVNADQAPLDLHAALLQGPPEVVVVVIADDNGRILLVRRSATESNRAMEWEVPGGHLNLGESVWSAAFREVVEETRLQTTLGEGFAMFRLRDEAHAYGVMLGARLSGGSEVRLDLNEHDRYEWVWPEDLAKYQPVPPNFVKNVLDVWTVLMSQPHPGDDRVPQEDGDDNPGGDTGDDDN